MKKIDKKDILSCLILILSFLLFFFIVTRFAYIFGSTLDWESQHSVLPDYFRTLFYDTHDIFPDFAFNIGNGQNIYNFAYYGLLSPIILFSYLLPFVDMTTYIVASSVVIAIASSVLFYFWERWNNKKNHLESFVLSFLLLFSASVTLHSHRHLMFVNYMPFLILGLFGVDKKLTEGKGWLLTLSVFLIIMTSYYYSVSALIALTIYGIYKYIKINDKITLKGFAKDGFNFALPIIIGVICSSIIIFPTLHVIISSRGETFNTITLADLLLPGANIKYVLYESYGMGLTAILILAIINLLYKKRENRFLGIFLSMIVLFPIVNYILNATMYIDGKILIPMMPLALIAIGVFLEDIFIKHVQYKKIYIPLIIILGVVLFKEAYAPVFLADIFILTISLILYKRFNKKLLIVLPVILFSFIFSTIRSYEDSLVSIKSKQKSDSSLKAAINWITNQDDSLYRISNERTILRDVNNIYGDIDYYTSTLYSSTYNLGYNRFYYDTINNPIQNRNRVITSPTSNILFLLFSGNKYIITNKNEYQGYELIKEIAGNKIYKTDNYLPLAYVNKNLINIDDYHKIKYPESSIALLKTVVVDEKTNSDVSSSIEKIELDMDDLKLENASLKRDGNNYIIEAQKKASGIWSLPIELKEKILFIRFHIAESEKCTNGDTGITIAGIENKLTCKEWKYHNQNYDFDYIIAKENLDSLSLNFKKGKYEISNVEAYVMDYKEIEDLKGDIDEFIFDKEKTKGDVISGSIEVTADGYFTTSIPFDEGFEITVDGEKRDYEKVNETFLGFKLEKGHHDIEIEYHAPYKDKALLLSCFGFILFLSFIVVEAKKEN